MPDLFAKGQILKIIAKSRENTFYDGAALGVSSINDAGPFDILPDHINFISIISQYFTVIKPDGSKQKIDIVGQAVLRVYKNIVYIYLGIAPPKNVKNTGK